MGRRRQAAGGQEGQAAENSGGAFRGHLKTIFLLAFLKPASMLAMKRKDRRDWHGGGC